jgi:hypothetical protein
VGGRGGWLQQRAIDYCAQWNRCNRGDAAFRMMSDHFPLFEINESGEWPFARVGN